VRDAVGVALGARHHDSQASEEWLHAVDIDRQHIVALRKAKRILARSFMHLLLRPPLDYNLPDIYYDLAKLCSEIHVPLRTQLMTIHAAIRQTGLDAAAFGGDPWSRPGCTALPPVCAPETYRRIRRIE
jgi:hypothetical protein